MALAERLPRIWYDGEPSPFWLRALEPAYRALRAIHRVPFACGLRKPQHLSVPVVVVGNITVGGTGKTPLTIALVEALRVRGFHPGVISRGYGGAASSPLLLDGNSRPERVGDEPVLIQRATGVPVAVGRDRVAAANLLLTHHACDVIIADDGLQHYPLFRNVEICVIDGERRFGNGRLLPAGPLREPLARLDTVDFCVVNGGVAQAGEVPMRLLGESVIALHDHTRRKPLRDFVGQRVHAVAGIGNPQRFFSMLHSCGINVIEHPFPDHHAFTPTDFDFGDAVPVLMTEKDAVKCTRFARENYWQLPVRAELPATFFESVVTRLSAKQ